MTVAVAHGMERLRNARQAAGWSIDEVSARTKIKPAQLIALEQGQYDRLPGEFFTRAFLRTYARELHLSEAEVIADYDRTRPAAAPPQPSAPPDVVDTVRQRPLRARDLNEPRFSRNLGSIALLAIAATAIVFALNRPSPPVGTESGAVGTTGAAATPPPAAAPAEPAPNVERLRITITPVRAVWITAFADGSRVLFRLVEAQEEVSVEAADRLAFRVGDAGAFAFTLNGRTGIPPGRPGEVREFTITRQTAASFVR